MEHVPIAYFFIPANSEALPDVVKAKVCIVGEAAVGKSSLVRRFVVDQFDERYYATLGAKVLKREVVVPAVRGEVRVVLTLWDVMGEPSFRELLKDAYFHAAQGVLAVGDVTRPPTMAALPSWIEAARGVSGPTPVVLLGNEADLPAATGAETLLEELADSLGTPRWRTSAKTGVNVQAAFAALAGAIVRAGEGGDPLDSARGESREAAPIA